MEARQAGLNATQLRRFRMSSNSIGFETPRGLLGGSVSIVPRSQITQEKLREVYQMLVDGEKERNPEATGFYIP